MWACHINPEQKEEEPCAHQVSLFRVVRQHVQNDLFQDFLLERVKRILENKKHYRGVAAQICKTGNW